MKLTWIALVVGVIILISVLIYFFLPICLLSEKVGFKEICVVGNRAQVVQEEISQKREGTSSAQPVQTDELKETSGPRFEKLPWENSTCGNGKCEVCESKDACCNYPPQKDKNGNIVYPPPTCLGQCQEDCP